MIIAQVDTMPLPDIGGLAVYGPLGVLFAGVTLLAWRYLPRLFDAMLDSIESGKKQSIRATESTERIEETMKEQTEHLATISESTAATAECMQDLTAIHKQQAEAMQVMLHNFQSLECRSKQK